ncbi:MAG: hypothetical protein QG661_1504 [Actinomycetota bacterium]|jgi:hypothetical protein|nr:hypothetical protein [Actinomycetota bacterium]
MMAANSPARRQSQAAGAFRTMTKGATTTRPQTSSTTQPRNAAPASIPAPSVSATTTAVTEPAATATTRETSSNTHTSAGRSMPSVPLRRSSVGTAHTSTPTTTDTMMTSGDRPICTE